MYLHLLKMLCMKIPNAFLKEGRNWVYSVAIIEILLREHD